MASSLYYLALKERSDTRAIKQGESLIEKIKTKLAATDFVLVDAH